MVPSPLRERISLPAAGTAGMAGRGEGMNDKYTKHNKPINFLRYPLLLISSPLGEEK